MHASITALAPRVAARCRTRHRIFSVRNGGDGARAVRVRFDGARPGDAPNHGRDADGLGRAREPRAFRRRAIDACSPHLADAMSTLPAIRNGLVRVCGSRRTGGDCHLPSAEQNRHWRRARAAARPERAEHRRARPDTAQQRPTRRLRSSSAVGAAAHAFLLLPRIAPTPRVCAAANCRPF